MNSEDRREILEQILSRQLDWISAVETRIGLLLTVEIAMLAALSTVLTTTKPYVGAAYIVACLSLAALVIALSFLCLASFPRLNGPSNSVIFFGTIAKRGRDEYIETMSNLSVEDYVSDLAVQVHRNAEIASAKFRYVRWSLKVLLTSVLFWGISFVIIVAGQSGA